MKPGGPGGRKPALYIFVQSPEETSVTRGCVVPASAVEPGAVENGGGIPSDAAKQQP